MKPQFASLKDRGMITDKLTANLEDAAEIIFNDIYETTAAPKCEISWDEYLHEYWDELGADGRYKVQKLIDAWNVIEDIASINYQFCNQ